MEYGLELNVLVRLERFMKILYVVTSDLKIVLGLPLVPIGIHLSHDVYVLHNTLIEAMVCVNIICGVAMDSVIMERIV
jgi:hypothetical protein